MSVESLYEETKNKIWFSAFAANNPRSDYHWHVDICYAEWQARGIHDKYQQAFDEVYKSEGH